MMKVYFSHGKESGPWGSKIKVPANIAESLGFTVESIDYTDISNDPDLRVERLKYILSLEKQDYVLVGSSMGGYVSLVSAEQLQEKQATSKNTAKGIFLIAPALYIAGYKQQSYNYYGKIEIVHGWSDETIPVENSIAFAKSLNCSLHLISGDHRLNCSMSKLKMIFTQFLRSLK